MNKCQKLHKKRQKPLITREKKQTNKHSCEKLAHGAGAAAATFFHLWTRADERKTKVVATLENKFKQKLSQYRELLNETKHEEGNAKMEADQRSQEVLELRCQLEGKTFDTEKLLQTLCNLVRELAFTKKLCDLDITTKKMM